jgi:O-antigen ligase
MAATLPPATPFAQLGVGGMLVVSYLVITRIGCLQVAKIGIEIGPIPLFLTELFVLAILGVVIVSRSQEFITWLLSGATAGWAGSFLWLLLLTSVVYCLAAVGQWGVLAVRDLAIFGYGTVFPLTYIVLDRPEKAATAMRLFSYSGIVLALALIGDTVSGLHVLFPALQRGVEGMGDIASYGGGDVGGVLSFCMAALLAYAAETPDRRLFHLGAAAICFYAIMIGQTRSATIGLVLASLVLFAGARAAIRFALLAAIGLAIALVVAIPVLFPTSSLARVILGFLLTLKSAGGVARDGDAYFRLLRWDAVLDLWRSNPLFGAGFGRPIIPANLVDPAENGLFNAGLPHNTYLTILARLGLVGFALIVIPWVGSIVMAVRLVRRRVYGADLFAAGSAMAAMFGFAAFVLFLERPMHSAALWMVAAIAARLSQGDTAPATAIDPLSHARRIAYNKGYR